MVDVTLTGTPSPARAERSPSRLVTLAAGAAAVALAVASASAVGEGSKAAVVMPLAAGLALLLAVLAATRFSAYVLLMLALRASIDLAKLSGPAAGTTESSGSRALDPASLLALVFLGASILWLAGEYRQNRLPGSGLRMPLLCFVATCAISVVGSAHPIAGGLQATRIAAAVAMFVVLEQLARRPGGIRRILLAVYVSALFPLAFTAASFLGASPRVEEKGAYERAIGPFNQSNEFGRYLMLLVVMGVALYPHVRGRLQPALVAILSLSSVFLVLTYTRTALLGTFIGLLVVSAVRGKRMLAGLVAAVALGCLLVPGAAARFTELVSSGDDPAASGTSLDWRLSYWGEVLPLARESPVTGIGLSETQYRTEEQKQPHNDFLRAYVETGLLGLGAYVAVLVAMIALGVWAVRRTARGTFERGAATGFLGIAVAFVAVSAVANVISNVVVLWYLFAYAAVAAALAHGAAPAATLAPVAHQTVPEPRET